MEMGMRKILVVDDHELVRIGLCRLIEASADVTVVGQCESGEAALNEVRSLEPDIVFMDIRMPGIGGLEATRRLLSTYPKLKVIVVSALAGDVYPARLLKAGAAGYITKSADQGEIQEALNTVIEGRIYISPEIAQLMVLKGLDEGQKSSPFASLSQRELEIARMVSNGHRAKEIAGLLNISPKTINTYKYRIFEKLDVSNDVELALMAVKYNLVDPDEVV